MKYQQPVRVMAIFFCCIFLSLLLHDCSDSGLITGLQSTIRGNNAFTQIFSSTKCYDYTFNAYAQKWDAWVYDSLSKQSFTVEGDSITVLQAQLTSGGSVLLNSQALHNASGTSSFHAGPASSLMPLDNSLQTWTARIPGYSPFYIQLKSPKNFAKLSYPQNGQQIGDSADITVLWNQSSSDENVVIAMENTNISATGHSPRYLYYPATDKGSFVIPKADLQTMPAGSTAISVRRGYAAFGVAPNSKSYSVCNYTLSNVTINLTH